MAAAGIGVEGPSCKREGHIVGAREGCHICRTKWADVYTRSMDRPKRPRPGRTLGRLEKKDRQDPFLAVNNAHR